MSTEFIVDNLEEQISTRLVKWLYASVHTIKGHISSPVLFHYMYNFLVSFTLCLFRPNIFLTHTQDTK